MGPEGDLVGLRWARGCRCFAGWAGDDVVAYGWLAGGPEWIGEIGLEIRPAAGEAYLWNCVTLPDHRLRGLFRALIVAVSSRLAAEGFDRIWIGSLEGTAEGAVAGAGYRPVLEIRHVPLGELRLLSVAAAPGADPVQVAAAGRALSVGPGRFITRLPLPRRH